MSDEDVPTEVQKATRVMDDLGGRSISEYNHDELRALVLSQRTLIDWLFDHADAMAKLVNKVQYPVPVYSPLFGSSLKRPRGRPKKVTNQGTWRGGLLGGYVSPQPVTLPVERRKPGRARKLDDTQERKLLDRLDMLRGDMATAQGRQVTQKEVIRKVLIDGAKDRHEPPMAEYRLRKVVTQEEKRVSHLRQKHARLLRPKQSQK
jgi:hypothetical protein